ncbi:MAG TPA: LD-carboxypeptidase [Gemmatimonadales bacterium]|nr:LD-carboxypeptidase [Gemmatimonadales bacterium]
MGSKTAALPRLLAPGSRVALIAPSGPLLERDDITRAAELCRALGHDPLLGAHAAARYGYLAGTDAERLADLNAALANPEVDAVWCLRGGYGLTRILDAVDTAALARRPKPIIGFSDITALLIALWRATGVPTFHGPTARQSLPSFTRRHFERVLATPAAPGCLERLRPPADVLVPPAPRIVTLRGGRAEGPLVGGNLSLLQCLIGTRWCPDFTGALLFLEDVNEDLYRIDRMLSHLRLAGVLDRVAGVVVGQFTEMKRSAGDGALGFDEVLEHYFGGLGVPVAYGFPIGHVDEQWTLPIGVRARLDADAGELELLEPAVA